jgi:hypothetical protein
MIFIELVKENPKEFEKRVIEVASYLRVDPAHLMFLMWFETAHTLDHRITNKIGATGLIQFMPQTAAFLGTTTKKLREMSNVEQLSYVQKHLGIFKGRYKDYVDLYCGIFWPAAVGKPDSYRITSDIVAKQNPLFDINKDGDIEKAEIRKALFKQIPPQYQHMFK